MRDVEYLRRPDSPLLRTVTVRGVNLAVWDWPGENPSLLFVHATGFHGRIWDQTVRDFPDRRVIAIDLRGHGRSSKPDPPYHWPDFGMDLAQAAEALKLEDAIGIGHSTGGHALVLAASERPATCAALLLIDPTIFPTDFYGRQAGDASYIARRRNLWKSPDEMFERFHDRPPFASWQQHVLHDYCEFGLLPQDDTFVLACPPAVEASIYSHATVPESNLNERLHSIRQPVTVLRGGIPWIPGIFNLNASPTDPDLAAHFPNGRDLPLPGRTHYIPMESPELVTAEIRAIAQALTLSGRTTTHGGCARP
jgi:pimeloyl-ACP methyl ester carboxylesterase